MGKRATDREGSALSVAIIGTGFAGIGMAIKLEERGFTDYTIFESASQVGGTWRDNTYPGCACDVPSHVYSYSFERNPDWSRHFSPQAEILEYIEACVDKYGVRPHIRFDTPIASARWDEDEDLWRLESAAGERFSARVLVAGTGPLRLPRMPDLPGLEDFQGPAFHSARWDHDVDLTGKRVAVVGTGASAVQFVPQIAEDVEELHIFQRTAPWVMAKPDGEISDTWRERFRKHPSLTFGLRNLIYWGMEAMGTGFFVDTRLNEWRQKMALEYMAETIDDPALREKLTPDYVMGCKRILFTNDYYPTLNRENVELLASGVREVRGNTIVASDGTEREVDAIIFGTGFEVSSFLAPMKVYGRGGVELRESWKSGVEAYYGVNVAGFPNMHILVGPNTGLGHNSIVFMIEAQVHFAMEQIERMRRDDLATIDVLPAAQREFTKGIQARLQDVVWNNGGCMSWYLDEHGKNVTLWPGYTVEYWLRTRRVKWAHFALEKRGAERRQRTPRPIHVQA